MQPGDDDDDDIVNRPQPEQEPQLNHVLRSISQQQQQQQQQELWILVQQQQQQQLEQQVQQELERSLHHQQQMEQQGQWIPRQQQWSFNHRRPQQETQLTPAPGERFMFPDQHHHHQQQQPNLTPERLFLESEQLRLNILEQQQRMIPTGRSLRQQQRMVSSGRNLPEQQQSPQLRPEQQHNNLRLDYNRADQEEQGVQGHMVNNPLLQRRPVHPRTQLRHHLYHQIRFQQQQQLNQLPPQYVQQDYQHQIRVPERVRSPIPDLNLDPNSLDPTPDLDVNSNSSNPYMDEISEGGGFSSSNSNRNPDENADIRVGQDAQMNPNKRERDTMNAIAASASSASNDTPNFARVGDDGAEETVKRQRVSQDETTNAMDAGPSSSRPP